MLKLKPPHGWNAVAWEFAIVTLGVLIALAAQQWAENVAWRQRTAASSEFIRDELAQHYAYAVEWRATYPCIQAQLDQLRERLLASGATMNPVQIHTEPGYDYVLRIPSKEYRNSAWGAAISDGVSARFTPSVRRELSRHYVQLASVADMNRLNNQSEQTLVAMARPIPLDPMVRYSLLREIETISGRAEFLDTINGQLIEHIQLAGMLPPPAEAQAVTERFGTYRFCKAQGFPLRPFAEAMTAVPN